MHYRFFLALPVLFTVPVANAQDISASAGGSYSTGRYGGDTRIDVAIAYIGLTGTFSDWRLDATLPYLSISSGSGPVDIGGLVLPGDAQKTRGIGDATLSVIAPPVKFRFIDVGFSGQVKLPTGKSGLTTGKVDASADVEFSRDVGAFSPFVSVGYRTYGDSSQFRLFDGWAASAGSSFTKGRTTLIASYDWSQSAVGDTDSRELLAVAAGPITRSLGWSVYGSKGLNSGAADFLFGAGLTKSFGKSHVASVNRRGR